MTTVAEVVVAKAEADAEPVAEIDRPVLHLTSPVTTSYVALGSARQRMTSEGERGAISGSGGHVESVEVKHIGISATPGHGIPVSGGEGGGHMVKAKLIGHGLSYTGEEHRKVTNLGHGAPFGNMGHRLSPGHDGQVGNGWKGYSVTAGHGVLLSSSVVGADNGNNEHAKTVSPTGATPSFGRVGHSNEEDTEHSTPTNPFKATGSINSVEQNTKGYTGTIENIGFKTKGETGHVSLPPTTGHGEYFFVGQDRSRGGSTSIRFENDETSNVGKRIIRHSPSDILSAARIAATLDRTIPVDLSKLSSSEKEMLLGLTSYGRISRSAVLHLLNNEKSYSADDIINSSKDSGDDLENREKSKGSYGKDQGREIFTGFTKIKDITELDHEAKKSDIFDLNIKKNSDGRESDASVRKEDSGEHMKDSKKHLGIFDVFSRERSKSGGLISSIRGTSKGKSTEIERQREESNEYDDNRKSYGGILGLLNKGQSKERSRELHGRKREIEKWPGRILRLLKTGNSNERYRGSFEKKRGKGNGSREILGLFLKGQGKEGSRESYGSTGRNGFDILDLFNKDQSSKSEDIGLLDLIIDGREILKQIGEELDIFDLFRDNSYVEPLDFFDRSGKSSLYSLSREAEQSKEHSRGLLKNKRIRTLSSGDGRFNLNIPGIFNKGSKERHNSHRISHLVSGSSRKSSQRKPNSKGYDSKERSESHSGSKDYDSKQGSDKEGSPQDEGKEESAAMFNHRINRHDDHHHHHHTFNFFDALKHLHEKIWGG